MSRTVILATLLLAVSSSFAQTPKHRIVTVPHSASVSDTARLNANRIMVFFNNRGYLSWGLQSWDGWLVPGALWSRNPALSLETIVYDAGIGLIGKCNGELRLAEATWGSSYSPGPIIEGKPALQIRPQDSTRYRPYKISAGDSSRANPDYTSWPVDLGAPIDARGNPRLYADQTVWMVYNNADTTARIPWWRPPFPRCALEIQQLAYSHASTPCDSAALLANAVFWEWTLINKDTLSIDSAYVIFWTDIDFGTFVRNIPAVDTVRQLLYSFSGHPSDPEAVGFVSLHGPVVSAPGDTAVFRGERRRGYRNLQVSSFYPIADDGSYSTDAIAWYPPQTVETLWNIARGYDKLGHPIVDPLTGHVTKFPWSGDPVTGEGWLGEQTGGGSGFYAFFGPFTMARNDTQWVQLALVPARGKDVTDAVVELRRDAEELRGMSYDEILSAEFPHIQCPGPPVPEATHLFQNYPNPFNGTTRIAYDLGRPGHVRIVVYDLLGRYVTTLVDETKDAGSYEVPWDGVGISSGVYICRMQTDGAWLSTKIALIR